MVQKMPYFVFLTKNALFWPFLGRIMKFFLIYLKSTLSNLFVWQISRKKWKCLNLDRKCLIWVSLDCKLKTILSYLKSAPSNLSHCKIWRENKIAQICEQKCFIWVYLNKKCLIWVFFGQKFKNNIFIFEIRTVKFVYLQNFTKKQKCLNLE